MAARAELKMNSALQAPAFIMERFVATAEPIAAPRLGAPRIFLAVPSKRLRGQASEGVVSTRGPLVFLAKNSTLWPTLDKSFQD